MSANVAPPNGYRYHFQAQLAASKPFKCPRCDRAFIKKEHMQRHLGIHVREGPLKCETCGKRFHMQHNLTNHVRVEHQGLERMEEEIFKCTTCGKAFMDAAKRNIHKKTHDVEAGMDAMKLQEK